MAKVGRNDPCTCGSEKKFKKCCGAPDGPRTIRPSWNPRTLLSSKPVALALFDQMASFYGDKFKIVEQDRGIAGSTYEISRHLTPEREVALDEVRIKLQMRSHRRAAALVHELLHLKLYSAGYPLVLGWEPDEVWSARALGDPSLSLGKMAGHLFNVVHHETFLPEFLSLGLPLGEFVGERTTDDIGEAAKSGACQQK